MVGSSHSFGAMGGMGKDVLFSGLCRDVKYLTHAFKMCQGLEVEGLRYETGVIRV